MAEEYTLDELKEQADNLESELEELETKEEQIQRELDAVNAKILARQKPTNLNLWDAYYDRTTFGQLPPQKDIPANLQFNAAGWARDGDRGFFFKPLVDLRRKFENSSDRIEKFASQLMLDFHKTYLCMPDGYDHSEEYVEWFNRNYDQAQRKRSFFGLGRKRFRVKPVYADFVGIDEDNDWSWATSVLPVIETRIFDMGLIWGGNVNAGGRDYNGITSSLDGFEKYWSSRRGANRIRQLAGNELVIMDRQYRKLSESGREKYLADHPGYVPVI